MRPTWDEYFMTIAVVASMRATCDRRRVGCVLAVDNHAVATGYNGSAPGAPHCDDVGHMMFKDRCVATTHAEINAIAQASKTGRSIKGCTAYVTTHPCIDCLKALIATGCWRVVHLEEYHAEDDEVSAAIAKLGGLLIEEYSGRRLWEQPIRVG